MIIKSKALQAAIDRTDDSLDTTLEGILITVMGDYEDAMAALTWRERMKTYTRNSYRKACRERLKQWLEGEIV